MNFVARMATLSLVVAVLLSGCATPAQPATPAATPASATAQPAAPAATPASKTEPTAVPTAAPVSGGTLSRAMTSEPVNLDPHGAANSGLNLLLPLVFDTLITRQADGKFVPLLAEEWKVAPDGLSAEFKLKKGVTFHDGTPLNAEAVKITFDRFKAAGQKSPIAANIKEFAKVEVVNDLTVRFEFAKPNASFVSTLAMPYAGILSPAVVKAGTEEIARKPVGTGPFKFEEWKKGASITLVRNPDYKWGSPEVENRGPVRLDSVVFKVIPDASTQLAALQAGEIDVIFTNEPSHLTKLEADKNFTAQRINYEGLIYLGYNNAKAPFDDVKVRQAMSHAVNKKEIIDTALGGLGTEANTLLAESVLGYAEDVKAHAQAFNLEKAKALLKEAGFVQEADGSWQRDGQKLSGRLLASNRAPNDAIATVLQSQFKALGVPVEIQQLDSAAVMKATNQGAFDLLLWRYEWNDPDGLNIFLSTSRIRQTNRVFYSNPKADALFEQGLREFDLEKRAKIYQDVQKIILDDAAWQPLYNPVEGLVYSNRIKGIRVGALGRMLVNDVTVTQR